MGSEVEIVFEKGEAVKAKAILKEASYEAPPCLLLQPGFNFACWIDWKGNKLEIGYSANFAARAWADALGNAIATHFKIKKAGWSSVGYCKTIEEVLH